MKNNDRYWDCLDQAMEASHGGRTDEALAWLDEALRAHPDGAEAHNGRGEILWDDGRVEEALYEFETSLKADPKFITAHLNRAELLVEDMGEYEQAVALCDELLGGKPDLPRLDRGSSAWPASSSSQSATACSYSPMSSTSSSARFRCAVMNLGSALSDVSNS